MTRVLDKGHLVLERWCGSDLDIANAARQSFDKRSESLREKDAGLINFLMRERHGSPFEHVQFTFSVRAPLFVSTQWVRHRAGHSFNFESGRYSELKPDFYVPDEWRTQVGKPGAYSFEPLDLMGSEVDYISNSIDALYAEAYDNYEYLLSAGVSKEQARMVLPVATYTSFTWSCNARSLMHWLGLRNSEHSQWEIREYAKAVEQEFARVLPVTYKSFIDNGRVSP